ncbi:MAG: hypothetical protein KKA79_08650 [Nanoarchaeota archaeon]|nr:hypothetical protein [Nanoarchaeota archaeon]
MIKIDKTTSKLEDTILEYFLEKGELSQKAKVDFDLKKSWSYFLNKKRTGTLHVKEEDETIDYQIDIQSHIFKRKKWDIRCKGGTLCDDQNKFLDMHVKEEKEAEENKFTIESTIEHSSEGGFSTWFYGDKLDTMRKLYEKIPTAKNLMTYQALKYLGMTCFTATVGLELTRRLAIQQNLWLFLVYALGAYATSTAVQTWMAKHNAEKITNKTPATVSHKVFDKEGLLMRSNKEINTWAHFEKRVMGLFEENRLSDQSLKEKTFGQRLQEGYFNQKFEIYKAIKNAKSKKEKIRIIQEKLPLDYKSLDHKELKELKKLAGKLKGIDEEFIKEIGGNLFESFEDKKLLIDVMKPTLEKFLKEDYVKIVTGEDKTKSMKLEDVTSLLERTVKESIRKNTLDENYEVIHKTTDINSLCTGLEVLNYLLGYTLLFYTANPLYVLSYYGVTAFTESLENTGQFRTWNTIFLEYYRRVMEDTNINQEQVWQDHDATFTKCSYKGGAMGTSIGFGLQGISNLLIRPHYATKEIVEGVEKTVYQVPELFNMWNLPITYENIPTLLVGGAISIGIYFVGLNYYFKWKNELKGQLKQELMEKHPESEFLLPEYQRSIPKKVTDKLLSPFYKRKNDNLENKC